MADPTTVIALIARIEGWLKALLKAEAGEKEKWRAALRSLQAALLKTRTYVTNINRGAAPNRETEGELSQLWQEAAIAFYGLDGALAERLQLKSEYWSSPEEWTSQQVESANIALDRVSAYTRQLLFEG